MAAMNIDYNQLARALIANGLGSTAGVGGNDITDPKGGLAMLKPEPDNVPGKGHPGEGESGRVGAWADDVIEQQAKAPESHLAGSEHGSSSGGSLSFADGVPVAGSGVREVVSFGGVDNSGDDRVPRTGVKTGYYATVVRSSNAKALCGRVADLVGGKLPKNMSEPLAVCTFTAGTMPVSVVRGKERLRALAAVGDAALTLVLMKQCYGRGLTVEEAQGVRTRHTSNAFLREAMVRSQLVDCVTFAPGVDPRTTVATATAFEAIVGALDMQLGSVAVERFLTAAGVLLA